MKLSLSILFLILLSIGCKKKSDSVYICIDEEHNTYHKFKDCKNLNKCNSDILFVPFIDKDKDTEEERNHGNSGIEIRRECGLCYGK